MADQPPKRKTLFDGPANGDADGDDALAAAARGEASVGEVLAHVRGEQGLEIADVSAHLRIREPFLNAIEAGDLTHLPGQAYAIGFVRSYADFLGLDGEEAVRLFKGERVGEAERAALVFPEPVAESRIPRGAILFISVLLSVAAYGGWYYLSSRDMQLADLVPHVPASLGGGAGDETPGAAPVAVETSTPPVPETKPDTAPAPETKPDTAPAPETKPDTARASQAESEPEPEPEPVPESAPPPKPKPEPLAQPQPAPPPKPKPKPKPLAQPQPAPTVEPTPAPVAQPTPAPAVVAETATQSATVTAPEAVPQAITTPGNIEIRAKADSWVQIRGDGGRVVMMRILRTGDSYKVPGEKGLTLMTGNAGAIEIMVDGSVVPAIGPFGAVRRDVALDPARLKAGTAAGR